MTERVAEEAAPSNPSRRALRKDRVAGDRRPGSGLRRLRTLLRRIRTACYVVFTTSLAVCVPFIIDVVLWRRGADPTIAVLVTLVALAAAALVLALMECGVAERRTSYRGPAARPMPLAAIVICSGDQAAPQGTVEALGPGVSVEVVVTADASRAARVRDAMTRTNDGVVGVFNSGDRPRPGSLARASRPLSGGYDVVQGRTVIDNGDASWVARLAATDNERDEGVGRVGRAALFDLGLHGSLRGYWRATTLRAVLAEPKAGAGDAAWRALMADHHVIADVGLVTAAAAPTSLFGLWGRHVRRARVSGRTARLHLLRSLRPSVLTTRQRVGALIQHVWMQLSPWVAIQIVPVVAFAAWRDDATVSSASVLSLAGAAIGLILLAGTIRSIVAYRIADPVVREHRTWFVVSAIHTVVWFAEFKRAAARVGQFQRLLGDDDTRRTEW